MWIGKRASNCLTGIGLLLMFGVQAARAEDQRVGLAAPNPAAPSSTPPLWDGSITVQPGDSVSFWDEWRRWTALARASQPDWTTPLVTGTALLEQRLRFDVDWQHAGNGADTAVFDGGRALDLIVSPSDEIQIALPALVLRSGVPGTPGDRLGEPSVSGFGDWGFLRVKHRLLSNHNQVLSVWLQVQAPAGAPPLTSRSWTFLPTIAFGEGWGRADVQGTVGGVIPSSRGGSIGYQVQTNVAFQYRLLRHLWPELEVNWTYYANGPRGGLNQVYLTPGLTLGRFRLPSRLGLTCGFGYQTAVSPRYRRPQTPGYRHAWLFTTRLSF